MSFFLIKTSTDKRIVGTSFPQIQTMGGRVNKNAPDSLYNVYSDVFPDFTPNLNYFVLDTNAKLTDVLSSAMIRYGFILNEKVKKLLSQYKLPPHKFYPAVVNHKGAVYKNFYWFFYISDILDFIDYNITEFFITDMIDNKIEKCGNIHSATSLRNLKEVLPNDRNIDSDFFFQKIDSGKF